MRRAPACAARRSPNGFTLVELLVTLAVLAMITMLSLPYITGGRNALGLVSESRVLASRLRAAREIALATRSATSVTVDLVKREVRGPGDASPFRFVVAERLNAVTAKGKVTGDRTEISFGPDGGSSGGTVILKHGARSVSVRVAWLTGAVIIGEVER